MLDGSTIERFVKMPFTLIPDPNLALPPQPVLTGDPLSSPSGLSTDVGPAPPRGIRPKPQPNPMGWGGFQLTHFPGGSYLGEDGQMHTVGPFVNGRPGMGVVGNPHDALSRIAGGAPGAVGPPGAATGVPYSGIPRVGDRPPGSWRYSANPNQLFTPAWIQWWQNYFHGKPNPVPVSAAPPAPPAPAPEPIVNPPWGDLGGHLPPFSSGESVQPGNPWWAYPGGV